VLQAYPNALERSDADQQLVVLSHVHGMYGEDVGCATCERYYAVSGLRIVRPAIEGGRVMDGVPDDIAERRYERWVMRAVELVYGNYPDNKVEAERVLLLRMQDSLVGNVSPTDSSGEGASTPEEVGAYSSDYGKDRLQDIRSLVAALYSAAGGDEWALNIKLNNDALTFVRVSGTSLESSHQRVDISVDVRSLACEDADDLRTLHERIARELPRREVSVEESANQALEAVEEIQGVLERVREISDALDTQEEMRNVRVALDNLWMVLAGIAAAEEDRRSRGGANRQV
jgi:hypothetical protein